MAGNPPLTHVLALLAEDWSRCRRRLDSIDRQPESDRPGIDDAFYLHPFSDVCRRICRLTGLDQDELQCAAISGFSNKQSVVDTLLPWEGERAIASLYSDLTAQHPAIAQKCGLPVAAEEQPKADVHLDDSTIAAARGMLSHLQSLASANTTVQSWTIWPPAGAPGAPPPVIHSAAGLPADTVSNNRADTPRKIIQRQPDNVDVRDLCKLLEQNQAAIRSGAKSELGVAREFTKEDVQNCPTAKNLLRQARRYPHLWKPQ